MKHLVASLGRLRRIGAAAALLLAAACGSSGPADQPQPETPNPYLNADLTSVNFTEDAAQQTVAVRSNLDWNATSSAPWLRATRQQNSLLIEASENDQKSVRTATVTLNAPSLPQPVVITVAQLGWGKAILISESMVSVPAVSNVVAIEVTANVTVEAVVEAGCDWIAEAPETRSASHPMVTRVRQFDIAGNLGDDERRANITFRDADGGTEVEPVELRIAQSGLGVYTPGNLDGLKEDILIQVSRGEASSYQNGEGIEKSFDGDKQTIYHSSWDNSGENYFPITLTYYFDDGADIDYFVYYPRPTGYNGHFKVVDIAVCTHATRSGDEEWHEVMTHDFGGRGSAARIDFPEPQIGVTAVRFTVRSGYGDNQGFASCAEMEFYTRNPENFDYATLFTDASCSELKPGITETEIGACPFAFFKNIAFYLFHDRYEKEFRIDTFRAYPHPDEDAATHKTSPYSLLDNPTGIAVAEGEQLVVLADLKGQSGVSLRVQNLDAPGGDGFGGIEYPLASGVNKLTMQSKGLAYVMYHRSDFETAPRVKLHFASGSVNGYYDSQRPDHQGRAQELLGKATDAYFDVVGAYAHLTFPTSRFRNHTRSLHALIEAFDAIVLGEEELLGLAKYGKMFRNRMYLNVMYHSYMYSTSYHTAYHDDTLGELCNENNLTTGGIWGPAHEIGHSNQTRPGMRWLGTTEVTNNIMSEYIQTSVFNQPSRLQTENMGSQETPNRYTSAWRSIMLAKIPHAAASDVFCMLVPFWQLELYFGKALGRTPMQQADKGGFYPDVYEYVRTHANLSTPGQQQLEFVYIASLQSECNLLDFFEKWGFLTPVDRTIDDYGTGQMTITQEMIDALRERVEKLGFPKPEAAIEYITDNNYASFRDQKPVVAGSATRSGTTLTMNDWQNVAVYEVREDSAQGRIVHVSDGLLNPSATATFRVPDAWKENYHVYAVAWDNSRTEVKF